MKLTVLILFLTLSLAAYGQTVKLTDEQINASGANKLIFFDSAEKGIELAEFDIKQGRPFLLLHSGIAPAVYPSDNEFENKFGVVYYEFGCMGPEKVIAEAYNMRILSYLTEKYGTKWKREIRKDVLGFKEWKRAQRKNK